MLGMTTPTPAALRAVTLTLTGPDGEPIGECAVRLVLPLRRIDNPNEAVDLTAWAITHALGSPAGGTHTEVAFVDDTTADLPTRVVDEVVRQVANLMYARSWAFHYLPERVADGVLAHGSILRERVEVSSVEVWT